VAKILSKIGDSLADTYDIEGSIAGIDQLNSADVSLVHDMSQVMLSERLAGDLVALDSPATDASTSFNVTLASPTATPSRIQQVSVINEVTNTVARLTHLAIYLRDRAGNQEVPIWVWDGTVSVQRMAFDGTVVATVEILTPIPAFSTLPSMQIGAGQQRSVEDFVMRGSTEAFGAGDITLRSLIYLNFPFSTGLPNRGITIPSW